MKRFRSFGRILAQFIGALFFLFTIPQSLADNAPAAPVFADELRSWIFKECQEQLDAKSGFLNKNHAPIWVFCYVKFEGGHVSILASVAATFDKCGPNGTLFSFNPQAEIDVENVDWQFHGEKLFVRGDCYYRTFGESPKDDKAGYNRIDARLERGKALTLLSIPQAAKEETDVRMAVGTALVIVSH